MKKIICIILAALMLISFAGCSTKVSENKEPKKKKPVIKETSISEEFKSSDGEVRFRLEAKTPKITKSSNEDAALDIERVIGEYIDNARSFAQKNVENAKSFMTMNNTKTPWSKIITFETTYCSADIVCFLIKDEFRLDENGVTPGYHTYCFNLNNSMKLSALSFARESLEPLTEDVLPLIIEDLNKNLYPNGSVLNDSQIKELKAHFDFSDFYIDEDNIYFYIPKAMLDETLSGYQICKLAFDNLTDYFNKPE